MKKVTLREQLRKTISVRGPFSFRTTMQKPSHFPAPLELFASDSYLVAAYVNEALYGVRVGRAGRRKVELTLYSSHGEDRNDGDEAIAEFARRLGLTTNLDGFAEVWASDDLLQSLDPELLGGRPSMPHALYHFLIICVLLQNTQVRRTVQMMDALLTAYGIEVKFPEGETIPAFWPPHELASVPEAVLRDLKLGYRAKSISRLSNQFARDPTIERSLAGLVEASELRRALLSLYGVGPATAGYLSFEWFKNCDDLVHLSPWETRILSRVLFGEEAEPDRVIAEAHSRWAPFTTLAAHAVFESLFWKRAEGHGPDWLEPLIRL